MSDIRPLSSSLYLLATENVFDFPQILELLLHNDANVDGVDVNVRDAKGDTPLHVALSR